MYFKKILINTIIQKNKKKKINFTLFRNEIITRYILNLVPNVHNGKKYVEVPINKFRLGKKLGEYSFTKTFKSHFKKKKKK